MGDLEGRISFPSSGLRRRAPREGAHPIYEHGSLAIEVIDEQQEGRPSAHVDGRDSVTVASMAKSTWPPRNSAK
jgi:hypothetical protein